MIEANSIGDVIRSKVNRMRRLGNIFFELPIDNYMLIMPDLQLEILKKKGLIEIPDRLLYPRDRRDAEIVLNYVEGPSYDELLEEVEKKVLDNYNKRIEKYLSIINSPLGVLGDGSFMIKAHAYCCYFILYFEHKINYNYKIRFEYADALKFYCEKAIGKAFTYSCNYEPLSYGPYVGDSYGNIVEGRFVEFKMSFLDRIKLFIMICYYRLEPSDVEVVKYRLFKYCVYDSNSKGREDKLCLYSENAIEVLNNDYKEMYKHKSTIINFKDYIIYNLRSKSKHFKAEDYDSYMRDMRSNMRHTSDSIIESRKRIENAVNFYKRSRFIIK